MNRVDFEVNGRKLWYDHDEFIAQKEFMRRKEIELTPPWLIQFMIDANETRTNSSTDIFQGSSDTHKET